MLEQIIMFVLFLLIIGVVLLVSFAICKNQWLKAIVIVLIKVAEKYINADGTVKMSFVKKIVLYIYQTVFKLLKLAIPDESAIEEYCQKIYDSIQTQIEKIKTTGATTTNSEVNKVIKEITKE